MSEMNAFVAEFVEEGNEKTDRVEHYLIQLEKQPNSKKLLNEVFRVMHSIKGATGFLGFARLGALTHAGESLLARLRDGALRADPEVTSALLSLVDAMRQLLSDIAVTGKEGNRDYAALVSTLARLEKSG